MSDESTSDETANDRPLNPRRVDLREAAEVRYWTERFGCSDAELRKAVHESGINVIAVSAYFAREGRPPFSREHS